MREPRSWTLEDLTSDSETSRELFRRQRLEESLALYSEFFNDFVEVFGRIIDRLPYLVEGSSDSERCRTWSGRKNPSPPSVIWRPLPYRKTT